MEPEVSQAMEVVMPELMVVVHTQVVFGMELTTPSIVTLSQVMKEAAVGLVVKAAAAAQAQGKMAATQSILLEAGPTAEPEDLD